MAPRSGPEERATFCRICEPSCGLVASVDNGKLLHLAPDPDHVVSKGYACVKGTRYAEVHNSRDRLRMPHKRQAGRFVPVSWEQALSEIGAKVQTLRARHGDQCTGLYMGNPAAFSLTHPIFAQAFIRGLGSRHFYTAASQDCSNKFAASEAMYGTATLQPIPDLNRTRCLIIMGSNPAISHMSFIHAPRIMERLEQIGERGGQVYHVNPRRTESAKRTGEQVFIRPDTDVFFLLAFAHELLARCCESPRVAQHLEGIERLRAAVQPWTPERSAEVTGIPAETLRRMVTTYWEADGASLYCSTGVNQGRNGTLAFWLINAINAFTGNLDHAGGAIFQPGLVDLASAEKRVGPSRFRSRIGGFAPLLGSLPAGILPDEILTPGEGQIRAMFVTAGNPLLSCPNGTRMQEALSSLDLLVSVDMFRNETGNLAHYILPACSFLERDDLPLSVQGFQPTPYLQYTEAVVPPDGEQKDEWWIFGKLAEACGGKIVHPLLQRYLSLSEQLRRMPGLSALAFSPKLLYQAIIALKPGLNWRQLRGAKHGMLTAPLAAEQYLGQRIATDDGRVQLAPPAYIDAVAGLEQTFAQERSCRNKLKLITKRERTTHNSWMHNVEAFVRGPRGTNYLYVHPDDAAAHGLEEGGHAEVRSKVASVVLPVKLSSEVMPGVVALPHGWGHQRADGLSVARKTTGVNANLLAADGPDSLERFSGMAQLTGLHVEVGPAPVPAVAGTPEQTHNAEAP